MKTLCITLISITSMLMLGILTFSCQNDDTINNPQSINQKFTPSPITIPSNFLVWDESYHPDEMKTKASGSINHSSEMAVTTPNIYIYWRSLYSSIDRGLNVFLYPESYKIY